MLFFKYFRERNFCGRWKKSIQKLCILEKKSKAFSLNHNIFFWAKICESSKFISYININVMHIKVFVHENFNPLNTFTYSCLLSLLGQRFLVINEQGKTILSYIVVVDLYASFLLPSTQLYCTYLWNLVLCFIDSFKGYAKKQPHPMYMTSAMEYG